jgi:xanthine dehydrogenase accessory factor
MNVSVLKEIHTAAAARGDTQLCFPVGGVEYVRRFTPAERLILLGCGHIGQALCRYAADLGFSVTAVDERPGFANHTQMPEAETILCDSFPKPSCA